MSDYSAVYGIDYAKGAEFLTDTTTRTGRFCALEFTSNAQIDTIVSNWTGNSLNGHQFDAGTTIYGVFTSVKLQNGHCVAYKL
jgi:hypothetical protein